jgi:hypothetical protein
MTSYSVTALISNTKEKTFRSIAPIVDKSAVCAAFSRPMNRERIYHAWPLFQMWLHQTVAECSCRETVAWAVANKLIPLYVSPRTAAYCNARVRLPETPMKDMLVAIGCAAEESSDRRRRAFHRRVLAVDGTSVQLQDTPENQLEYPQPGEQEAGCGQPVMSAVALMGLGSGAILDLAVGGGFGYERTLFRKLWPSLAPGDILIADNGFCSYAEFVCLMDLGVDLLMAQRKNCLNNKEIRRIADGDYIVEWRRGAWERNWIDKSRLPKSLIVRAITFSYTARDGSVVDKTLFTTLLDPKVYPRRKLIELYRRRWEIEVSFDNIKTEMGLDLLKCKSPKQCRCEFLIGLIAYNILRSVMLDAARHAGLEPRRISFAGAVSRIKTCLSGHLFAMDPSRALDLLMKHLIVDIVPERPGRNEPRKVKRRPKNYRLLSSPRNSLNHASCTP